MANDLPQGITESPIQSSAPLPAIEKPLGNGTTDVGTDLQQNQSSALAAGYPVHTQSGIIQPKTPPPALPPGITESPLPPAGITESPIAQGAAKTAGQAVQPPTSDADRDLMSTVTGFEGGPPAQSLDEQFQISKKAGRFLDAWQRGLTVTPVTGFEKDVPTEVPSREQFAKEHPYASGIAETLGEKVGGLVASPEYWPILAMPFGSAAPFLIKLAIQAGFTTAMAQSVFSQASQAGADWDQLSQQEKVKRVTSMSVDGAMAGFAAKEAGETTLKGGVGAVKSAAAAVKGAVRPGEVKIAGKTAPVSAPQAGKPVAQVLEKFTTPGSAEEYQRTQTMPKAQEQAVSTVGQPMKDRIEAHKAIANGEPAPDKIAGTSTPAPYNTFDDIVKDAKDSVQPMWDKADAHDVEVKAKYDADVAQQKQAIADHNKKVDEYNAGLGKDETPMDRAKFDPDQVEKPQILSELRSALQQAKANGASADPAIRAKAWETDVPKAEKDIDTWFKQNSDVVSPAEYESGKDLWRHAERVQDIANGLRGSMAKGTMTGNTLRGIEASMDNKAIRRQGPSGVGTFKRLLGDDGYENWQNVARLFDPVGGKSSVMRSAGTYALEMLAAHLFGPAGIGVKLGSELLLNRILFDKTWGGWFSRAASFVKSTPAGVAPVIPNDLVQEGADHLKTEMPAQTKLSQRPATEMTPQQIQQLKAVGMTDEDIASLNKIRATRTTAPAIGEGVGGHAGGEMPVATPGHSYNYEENADMHQVTVRDPEGKSVALIHAVEDPNDPNTWTTKFTAGGGGEGLKGYARLAEAAKSQAERTDKPVQIQGDVPDDMSGAARRTWQKLQEQHGYDVKWDNNDPSTGRPSVTFQPKGPETPTTPAPTAPEGTPKLSQKAGVARARAKVTNSPEFKNWFGDSKVVEKEGTPKVVFHGTTHEFNQFEPERGSVEGQYGKGIYFTDSSDDMSHNYAGEGPDLTSRIEQRAEQIENEEQYAASDEGKETPHYGTPEYEANRAKYLARAKEELMGSHKGVAMPVYLKMENPIEMSQRGKGTYFDLDTDEDGNESGSALKLYQAVHDVAGEYGLDPQKVWSDAMEKVVDFDHFSAHQFDRALDATLGYAEVQDDTGAQALGDMKRKIYQAAGFDGIVTTASDDFPHMKNIPAGTKHYIAFEPEQVKSATGNTGAFDPNNPDIRLSQEDVSLEDWDKFREAPAPLEHPITHDMLKDAFHGQDVQQVDPRNYIVKLDNGSDLHVNLVDSITGPSVEMQLKPGNVALGSFQKIGDGGIMQLAGISGEATLGHETAHAGLGLLPKRLQDAVLEKFQGDEEKFADWYGDNRKTLDRGGEPDSLFGQIKNYFQDLYEKVFKPAQYAMRQIQEGRVWDRANEKFVESADLRPALSQKTYPAWEKSFRKAAAEQGATPDEIERHIKEVAPAYGLFKGLTDVPPDLKGSNLFDNAWEGKKTTFEYQGFCPKNKNFNPTKAAIEQQIGRFLSKQETVGLTLLMHSEALDAPCNYCYTLSGQAAVSENLGNTARNGVWVGGENIPETDLKLQTRPHPDKPGATQTFIPPVEERLLTDSDYREKMIAKDPELADKVKLQQWYGDKKVYGNLKAHKPTEEGIIPARGALLRKSPEEIAQVNSKRGYRVSGNVDVTPYSYMDVAQDLADARLMGAKRYSYTKQPDYVRLVGNTGEKINMSLTMDPRSTDFIKNDWSDSMNYDDAKALRKQFPNAGTMLMTLNDNHILAGLKNPDVDMMIPYHGTRGKFPAAVKEFVQDYSRENHETDMKTGDTISGDKEIKQTEHNGDLQTYLRICKERGYLPKFARFIYDNVTFNKSENGVSSVRIKTDPETGEPEPPKIRKDTSKNYMKLVKDIARTDSPHVPIQRNVDMDHLNSVVSQIKAGNMPWSGQAHPGVTKMAVDRIKAGKPLYNGEMGYSYTPKAEVPLVQIQPASKSNPRTPANKAGQSFLTSEGANALVARLNVAGLKPVGSVASRGQSLHDLDLLASSKETAAKARTKLEANGFEWMGSGGVSPKEAARYGEGKDYGDKNLWSVNDVYQHRETGKKLEVWHKEPAEK